MIDWSKAPEWATYLAKTTNPYQKEIWANYKQYQYKDDDDESGPFDFNNTFTLDVAHTVLIEERPVKICMVSSPAINPANIMEEETLKQAVPNLTSIDLLKAVQDIQSERAKEYEQDGGERSFAKIASVFNTYTGKDLLPSDIALIFEILKNVRFYAQEGLHKDSVIDKISYASLWGELVTQERSE